MQKELTFLSGNVNKVLEMQNILKDVPKIKIVSQSYDIPEYQGNMIDISSLKVKHAYSVVKKPVFVEDTSLCFMALNGLPGPYIKWFVDGDKNNKLETLRGLRKMLVGFDNFNAEAVTIISFFDQENMDNPLSFIGRRQGQIVEPRGPLDFDWDCVFEPDVQCAQSRQTYAEMDKVFKNCISNRYLAAQQFKDYLINNYLN